LVANRNEPAWHRPEPADAHTRIFPFWTLVPKVVLLFVFSSSNIHFSVNDVLNDFSLDKSTFDGHTLFVGLSTWPQFFWSAQLELLSSGSPSS
jgi:hypothetical protein